MLWQTTCKCLSCLIPVWLIVRLGEKPPSGSHDSWKCAPRQRNLLLSLLLHSESDDQKQSCQGHMLFFMSRNVKHIFGLVFFICLVFGFCGFVWFGTVWPSFLSKSLHPVDKNVSPSKTGSGSCTLLWERICSTRCVPYSASHSASVVCGEQQPNHSAIVQVRFSSLVEVNTPLTPDTYSINMYVLQIDLKWIWAKCILGTVPLTSGNLWSLTVFGQHTKNSEVSQFGEIG